MMSVQSTDLQAGGLSQMSWLWGSSAPAYGEASGAVKALVEENEDLTRRLEARNFRAQFLRFLPLPGPGPA